MRRRGMTMIEILVAALILMVSCAGVVSMWYVAYAFTHQADETGLAYTVGRRTLESLKQTGYSANGFQLSADGATTRYYDAQGNDTTASPSGHVLAVQTRLTTNNGLQTALVTVIGVSEGLVFYQSLTYLVRNGI